MPVKLSSWTIKSGLRRVKKCYVGEKKRTNSYTRSMVCPSLYAYVQQYNQSNVGEDDPLKIVVRVVWGPEKCNPRMLIADFKDVYSNNIQ